MQEEKEWGTPKDARRGKDEGREDYD